MKKVQVFLVTVALIAAAPFTHASENLGLNLQHFGDLSVSGAKASDGGGSVHKGMIILQPDFNMGSHGSFGGFGGEFIPGFTFNADFGVHDYVSVGPFVGLGGKNNYMEMAIGARGVFHWWQLLDDKVNKDLLSDKIDFYLPVHMGVYMGRFDFNGNGSEWDADFNAGSGLGFRYYFVKQFGVNLEWGWMELSWAKFGFTVNMN